MTHEHRVNCPELLRHDCWMIPGSVSASRWAPSHGVQTFKICRICLLGNQSVILLSCTWGVREYRLLLPGQKGICQVWKIAAQTCRSSHLGFWNGHSMAGIASYLATNCIWHLLDKDIVVGVVPQSTVVKAIKLVSLHWRTTHARHRSAILPLRREFS